MTGGGKKFLWGLVAALVILFFKLLGEPGLTGCSVALSFALFYLPC